MAINIKVLTFLGAKRSEFCNAFVRLYDRKKYDCFDGTTYVGYASFFFLLKTENLMISEIICCKSYVPFKNAKYWSIIDETCRKGFFGIFVMTFWKVVVPYLTNLWRMTLPQSFYRCSRNLCWLLDVHRKSTYVLNSTYLGIVKNYVIFV